jgi:hypothetical protein
MPCFIAMNLLVIVAPSIATGGDGLVEKYSFNVSVCAFNFALHSEANEAPTLT